MVVRSPKSVPNRVIRHSEPTRPGELYPPSGLAIIRCGQSAHLAPGGLGGDHKPGGSGACYMLTESATPSQILLP